MSSAIWQIFFELFIFYATYFTTLQVSEITAKYEEREIICRYWSRLLCNIATKNGRDGEAYSEPSQTSNMELSLKIDSANHFKKDSYLNAGLGSKYDTINDYISKLSI